jgi:hypothetical protein
MFHFFKLNKQKLFFPSNYTKKIKFYCNNNDERIFSSNNVDDEMKTFSFYKFVKLSHKLPKLKNHLKKLYNQLGVVGRVYISSQGING